MGHIRRVVGLATVGHRGQVGAVGLDEHAVQRHKGHYVAQLLRALESDDARERDVVAPIQRGARHLHGLGKAVEHAARLVACAILALFPQDGQRVVGRTARVNDERLATGPRRTDVGAEAVALPLQVGNAAPALAVFHAVVVEAGLSNRHHAGQCGAVQQVLHAGFRHALVVGVHAHRAPEVVMGQGQGVHALELFHGGADAQGPGDLRLGHGLADGGQLADQFREVEVAVRIGEHGIAKQRDLRKTCFREGVSMQETGGSFLFAQVLNKKADQPTRVGTGAAVARSDRLGSTV